MVMKTPRNREPDVPPSYASAIRAIQNFHAALERCRHDHSNLVELAEALMGTPFPVFESACRGAVERIDLECRIYVDELITAPGEAGDRVRGLLPGSPCSAHAVTQPR